MDKIDLRIIEELQKDGRGSYADMGRMLGVVEGTVRKRVKHLLDEHILKVIAVPNMSKMGYTLMSIMGIQTSGADVRKVADTLIKSEHICYVAYVTGRFDLIAFILARSPEELSRIIEGEIRVISSIERTETFVSLDILKGTWGVIDTVQLIEKMHNELP